MTSLTFGNHLKFGQDSHHTSKGRQIPSSTKRKRAPEALREPHQPIERGLQRAPCTWEHCHGRWLNEGLTTAVFCPDRGRVSTICMKTWSIVVFSGVKLVILLGEGLDLLSSLRSFVQADFLPLSWWKSSYLSLFFGLPPRAIMAFSMFIYLVALYNMLAIVFGPFL